jgi:hypothetical protein
MVPNARNNFHETPSQNIGKIDALTPAGIVEDNSGD